MLLLLNLLKTLREEQQVQYDQLPAIERQQKKAGACPVYKKKLPSDAKNLIE